jgi:hypothetical protein
MFMYAILYSVIGTVYLYWKSMIDDELDYWSPIQPVFAIIAWPYVLVIDILNRIKQKP